MPDPILIKKQTCFDMVSLLLINMAYAFLFINSESVNGEMPKYKDKFKE